MGATATADGAGVVDGAGAGDCPGGVTSLPPELDWKPLRLRLRRRIENGEGQGRRELL
jgi:hypothetical protein